MEELRKFIEAYLDELRIHIGQFPKIYWTIFPDYYYRHYIIHALKCVNGIAIRFWRPARKDSIKIINSKKRVEEVYLPYLPPPQYYPIFHWTNARRVTIIEVKIVNFDFSLDPEKGKRFQRPGENFNRRSVMHLTESNEVQMINCWMSGVNDKRRFQLFIRFLWMMTEDCVELTINKARAYAHEDFNHHLDRILFIWSPTTMSKIVKKLIIEMLNKLRSKYKELICRTDIDEQEIQDFLEDHKFLIDPSAIQVWPKQSLGEGNQADFIIGYNDSIRIVEIKRPFDRIFTKQLRFSSKTCEALSELNRYQEWIKMNKLIVTGRFGSSILGKSWGIIGRALDINKKELEKIAFWNSESNEIELLQFDSLINNFDIRIKQLGNS